MLLPHTSESLIRDDRLLQMTDVSNDELQSQKHVLSYWLKVLSAVQNIFAHCLATDIFSAQFRLHFPMSVQCCLERLTDCVGMSAKNRQILIFGSFFEVAQRKTKGETLSVDIQKTTDVLKQFFSHLWQHSCHFVSKCFFSYSSVQQVFSSFATNLKQNDGDQISSGIYGNTLDYSSELLCKELSKTKAKQKCMCNIVEMSK